jgi:hypothetical protein
MAPLHVPAVRSKNPADGDLWGVAMPYGSAALKAAAAHWQPVEALLEEARVWLKGAGYALEDVLQGRSWEGIPFLVDFSDLRRR